VLHYQITLADPAAHLIRVTLRIEAPSRKGHQLLLPAWIPGSYMIREFARHLSQLKAEENMMPVAVTQLDKHTWQLAPNRAAVSVSYVVYAWDLSVRAAHFDDTHAFFNPSVICLLPVALRDQPIELELKLPKPGKHWRVATTLPLAARSTKKSLRFVAPDYDSLIDHPFECGDHTVVKFNACGTPHEVVIHGVHDTNTSRLSKDLQAICCEQIAMFGGRAPFDRYLFMTTVTGDGYGGL
jgi:predicted metalloprotease with PDZ domain